MKMVVKALVLGTFLLSASVAFPIQVERFDGAPYPNCDPGPPLVCRPQAK
jgi:hypothetical protein